MEVRFTLDERQRKELQEDLYELGKSTIERLEKEYHLQSQLMNKTQVRKFLNNASAKQLEHYIREGLPFHRLGERTYLFDRDEVLKWLRSH
jgi:hypothetical protein